VHELRLVQREELDLLIERDVSSGFRVSRSINRPVCPYISITWSSDSELAASGALTLLARSP
jgi:hypothetical protein